MSWSGRPWKKPEGPILSVSTGNVCSDPEKEKKPGKRAERSRERESRAFQEEKRPESRERKNHPECTPKKNKKVRL